jgi:hypothetical protein
LKSIWTTQQVLDQPRLFSKTLSQKLNKSKLKSSTESSAMVTTQLIFAVCFKRPEDKNKSLTVEIGIDNFTTNVKRHKY